MQTIKASIIVNHTMYEVQAPVRYLPIFKFKQLINKRLKTNFINQVKKKHFKISAMELNPSTYCVPK